MTTDLTFAQQLEGMLYPERFPPGHARHDAEHIYWSGWDEGTAPDPDGAFEWDSGTIEWVADAIERQLRAEGNR